MKLLIWLIGSHFLADMPLQGEFLAKKKRRHWLFLVAHCWIYAFVVSALNALTIWEMFFLLFMHLVIDYFRTKLPEEILLETAWEDQLAHLLAILVLWLTRQFYPEIYLT